MSGGYDYDIVEEVKQDFYCVICLNLMKDAMQLTCGHGMCNYCLQSLAQSSSKRNVEFVCPSCRESVDMDKVHTAGMVNRFILSIKVKCVNVKDGCSWIGEISDMKAHCESKCAFQEVKCTMQSCPVYIIKAKLADHESQCEFRMEPCEYCGELVVYNECGAHLKVCPKYAVICPNNCGEIIPRFELPVHLKTCPLSLVECTFKKYGCHVETTLGDMNGHLSDYVHNHLSMVATYASRIENELAATQHKQAAAINKLQNDVTATKHELSILQNNQKGINMDVTQWQPFLDLKDKLTVEYDKNLARLSNSKDEIYKECFTQPLCYEESKLLLKSKLMDVVINYGNYDIKMFVNFFELGRVTNIPDSFWSLWDSDLKEKFMLNISLIHLGKCANLKIVIEDLLNGWDLYLTSRLLNLGQITIDNYGYCHCCKDRPVNRFDFWLSANVQSDKILVLTGIPAKRDVSIIDKINGKEVNAKLDGNAHLFSMEDLVIKNSIKYNIFLLKISLLKEN
ncbi:TNF receptor-associated factor 3-like isoform X2 [Hydractinia symbiolongicarpus]|uniref:TNF receptor-associated factor 3-like isoform X2 n=1 Tax=Hydractinia symbiolongicarpus TaxID=13093 RepID=UPI00254F2392|nr:TNF receptor-associated factor 3-like isoform X2 [Hydractinia symbiolongicarpus]